MTEWHWVTNGTINKQIPDGARMPEGFKYDDVIWILKGNVPKYVINSCSQRNIFVLSR